MKTILFWLGWITMLACPALGEGSWKMALPGWKYSFPRDHASHGEFKTEWWYFTGNVQTNDGRAFGYQLTFFRQGIRPPAVRGGVKSRFILDDLKFAHFAVSDPEGRTFLFDQKTSRGAFGEAGFSGSNGEIAWIDNWVLKAAPDGSWTIQATLKGAEIKFSLQSAKPWITHGGDGVSQKATGAGQASHYYSGTRLLTKGRLRLGEQTFEVSGTSWFDHEWASNQLGPEQVGWDWFSIQLEDGTELMLYQLRMKSGGVDPHSSGTFIAADATASHIPREGYQLTPTKWWNSPESGGRYPVGWTISCPEVDLALSVETPMEKQELVLSPVTYWEGMIRVTGTRAGKPVKGTGYMELTGYAGPLVGLAQPVK